MRLIGDAGFIEGGLSFLAFKAEGGLSFLAFKAITAFRNPFFLIKKKGFRHVVAISYP